MWGSDKSRGNDAKADTAAKPASSRSSTKAAKPNRPSKPTASIDTLIGKDTRIIGDVHFSGGLHVDGRIEGRVIAEKESGALISISESGVVEGSIRAPFVSVKGLAEGDVQAFDRITLSPTATVVGNVFYKVIELPAGATVNGQMFFDDGSTKLSALPSNSEFEAVSDGVKAGDASEGTQAKTQL